MTATIMIGDCRDMLAQLPDESVHCVVTSPPYWGLRDYGVAGQIGMEATMQEHLTVLVDVFRHVRRVLRKDGTLWLNYGDGYAAAPNGRRAVDVVNDDRTFRDKPFSTVGGSCKPKDLLMIPNRLAIALQDDGWWVRSEIIWAKTNPMPESARDRPSQAHEKLFLLTKSSSYSYDYDAAREPFAASSKSKTASRNDFRRSEVKHSQNAVPGQQSQFRPDRKSTYLNPLGRNRRNVWTIATAAFRDAHFATFPPALVKPCILAGCPFGGVVLDPFGGAGTVGMVAEKLGRDSVLIELNADYAQMSATRIRATGGWVTGIPHPTDRLDSPPSAASLPVFGQ